MTSLHPSITHINAKNLSESTIKIINNMVELAINKMESNSTELKTLKQINLESIEGRYLLAAMAKITTESQTDKTPDEVLDQLTELQKHMYKDSPPVINLTTEVTRLREALEVPTLKPIESITDEDAIQVAEICFPKRSTPTKRVIRRESWQVRVSIMGGSKFEMWLAIQFSNGDVYQSSGAGKNAVSNLSQVYEFLQSKGYDLPKYVDNSPKP